MPTSFDLSHFSLHRAILEIRYQDALLLWDRSGFLWHEIKKIKPDLKIQDATPMVTTFFLENKFDLTVKTDRSHIVDTKPISSLKDFIEISETFFNRVMKVLEITELLRVGFRLIYAKEYSDRFKAANSLIDLGLIKLPKGKHFNIEGKVVLPQYAVVWEDDSKGLNCKFVVQDKKIDFDPSPNTPAEIQSLHIKKHELVLDLDYYTSASVAIGQLNVSEWLSQAYHVIKRDIKPFIGVLTHG